MNTRVFVIILSIFAILSAGFYYLHTQQPQYSYGALMGGNILMAILSLSAYFIVQKQLKGRPEAFVRGVYGATFLKLLVCMAAILIYVVADRKNIHKPSLFMLFGIYAVYTAAETWILSKIARRT